MADMLGCLAVSGTELLLQACLDCDCPRATDSIAIMAAPPASLSESFRRLTECCGSGLVTRLYPLI